MPRFSARNAVILFSVLLLTALFLHLRSVLWDNPERAVPDLAADLDTSLLEDDHREETSPYREDGRKLQANSGVKLRRTAIVVASQKSEDATWLEKYFPRWEQNIYRVDNPNAPLTVPKNKGRESMVYLTCVLSTDYQTQAIANVLCSYIIDNYDNLPDNILFIHPNRYQWHNDDPDYDGLPMLRHFQIPYLEQEGYVNIRCAWSLGCPNEIKPLQEEGEHREAVHAGGDYKKAFEVLFPEWEVPSAVGVSCCAQFAATKEKIRERKREDYVRYRDWLIKTELDDSISGRVFEYSWHSKLSLVNSISNQRLSALRFTVTQLAVLRSDHMLTPAVIFGKKPVHCPSAKDCYCKVFGLCNLTCPDKGSCNGRYILPPFSSLPEGWPLMGWEHEPRRRFGSEE
jgi:hypothetical protein